METFLTKKYKTLLLSNTFAIVMENIQILIASVILGNVLGMKALAAYAICMAPLFFVGILRSSICTGAMACYVREANGGEKGDANLCYSMGLWLSLFCGIVSVLAFYFLMPSYLDKMNLSAEVQENAKTFIIYYLPTLFFRPLNEFFGKLVICDGGTKNCSLAFSTACIVIPVVNYVLCCHIGIGGIGLGETIGRALTLLILLTHFLSSRCSLRVVWKWSWRYAGKIFQQGASLGSVYFSSSMNLEILNRLTLFFAGDAYLPLVAIFLNFYQLADLGCGASYALVPLVGGYQAEKNTRGMQKTLHLTILSQFILGTGITLIIVCFPQIVMWLVGIKSGSDFYVEMCRYSRILSLMIIPTTLSRLFYIYYMAIGKLKLAMISPFFFNWFCFDLLLPVTCPFWGIAGMVWGISIGCWCIFPVFFLCLRLFGRYKWHEIPLLLPGKAQDKNILIFNFYLVPQQINAVVENMDKALKRHNVSLFVRTRSKLVLREAMKLIREQNKDIDVLAECTLNMNGDTVSITLKDTGVVFDITSESISTKTFHTYIMGCLMLTQRDKRNQFVSGFNCNSFSWAKDAQSDRVKE